MSGRLLAQCGLALVALEAARLGAMQKLGLRGLAAASVCHGWEAFLLPPSLALCLGIALPGRGRGLRQWRWAVVLGIALVLVCAGLVAREAGQVSSARRGQGWFGASRPVVLTTLGQITERTAMRFPADARLIDGESMGGLHPYLVAKIEIPLGATEGYLAMQAKPFQWSEVSRGAQRQLPEAWARQLMARRGWHPVATTDSILAIANKAPRAADICQVLISPEGDATAIIYVYWEQT
jgi:hypothetical protein